MRMASTMREGRSNYDKAYQNMEKVYREAPRLSTKGREDELKAIKIISEQGLDLVQKEILNASTYTLDPAVYLKNQTDVIEGQFKLTQSSLDLLRTELNKKISDLQAGLYLESSIMSALIVIALVLGFAIIRSVIRPVTQLQGVMEGLRKGDSTLRARLESMDEIGELGRQFDTMVDEREAVATKIKKENEALNDSILDIMRSVSKLAQGDLRVRAPVREDITGALSDAINTMAEATAKALSDVSASSEAVRAESKTGRETVLSTAKGMNEVRGTMQETGKRIKRLGERSQEIGGIVKLIDDIAERTSVLALNANMQAAVAGEAGRGFRVVADEVQRLAERSKEATDQIGKLVAAVQSETNDTIATMERAIGEVIKGGELAERAAAQVSGLEKLGGDLHDAVQAFTLPEEARAVAPLLRRAA
jgi:methyl-accepting chemotaxis protein